MNLKEFIQSFIKRKGIAVGFASAIEKVGGLILVLIMTHLISKNEVGLITYANTSIMFIIPFIGFGIHHGLIRYAGISGSQVVKRQLFIITLKKGIKYSIILAVLMILAAPLISYTLTDSKIYIYILSLQLISLFLFEIIRVYARLLNINKLYAQISVVKVVFVVVFALLGAFLFKGIGYTLSLAITPLIVSAFYMYKLDFFKNESYQLTTNFNLRKYINFGLFTSLAGVLSQLLYAVDIILIGNILMDEAKLAQYKVSFILPLSLLFLPIVFIQTDYVKIVAKSENDKNFIWNYFLNFLKIFSVIGALSIVFFWFFSDNLIHIFGKQYTNQDNLMFIFSIGVAGGMLLRVPLGNILAAIGWPKVIALNSFVVLVFNLIFSSIFIYKYGIVGAAYVTAAMMWFSGILLLIAFLFYLKKKN
jgi:O-antigen/teichoic acid export membrane protein